MDFEFDLTFDIIDMTTGFFGLVLIMFTASGLAILARLLKQPLILAYLLTGVVIAYFNFFNINNGDVFRVFSDLGIMFLLFLIGLEINYSALRTVGKTSLVLGLSQIIITFLIGLFIALSFQFHFLQAAYIAIALTFSSTIIILKLLSEKKDLHSLYGKISIGFLLVQDFVAILILILLAGVEKNEGLVWATMTFTILKGVLFFGIMLWLGRKILPLLFDKIAKSEDLLFLLSLTWVFFIVSVVKYFGFSIEIGGFLAGIALANSSEHFQIAGRIKPLRDFFIVIFFVILGSSLVFSGFEGLLLPIIVFSLFVLIGNPLIVFLLMSFMGYRKRTSFLTGLTVAQISEFSLILVALGLRLEHIGKEIVALITIVGVITITSSTYFVYYGDYIFKYFVPLLSVFERKKLKEKDENPKTKKSIILIGCHRTGESIAFSVPKKDLLIIDFDPEVIKELHRHGFDYVFGDIADPEIFERADFGNAKLVISTSPVFEDNLSVIFSIKHLAKKPKIVVRAENEQDAQLLYEKGADYVILPHFTAGQYLGKTIAVDPEMSILHQLRKRDLDLIKKVAKTVL